MTWISALPPRAHRSADALDWREHLDIPHAETLHAPLRPDMRVTSGWGKPWPRAGAEAGAGLGQHRAIRWPPFQIVGRESDDGQGQQARHGQPPLAGDPVQPPQRRLRERHRRVDARLPAAASRAVRRRTKPTSAAATTRSRYSSGARPSRDTRQDGVGTNVFRPGTATAPPRRSTWPPSAAYRRPGPHRRSSATGPQRWHSVGRGMARRLGAADRVSEQQAPTVKRALPRQPGAVPDVRGGRT